MRYAAFFDLDNTLLKVNSGEAILRRAYKNGLLSFPRLIRAYLLAILYKAHLLDPLRIIEKLGGWLAESSVDEVEKLCDEIVEKDLIPAIRPEIIAEIEIHRDQGARLVILSSAIDSICLPLAKYLEMHSVICSELEVVDKRYTGRPKTAFCFRDEKLIQMNQYLGENDYSLKDSWYYADSIDDLPVMMSVGNAVCVNPDKRLGKMARKYNWVILELD